MSSDRQPTQCDRPVECWLTHGGRVTHLTERGERRALCGRLLYRRKPAPLRPVCGDCLAKGAGRPRIIPEATDAH